MTVVTVAVRDISILALPPATVLGGLVAAGFAYIVAVAIYRLYFHPLAKYPGPFLARITDWYSFYYAYKGLRHLHQYDLHQKYGDFVRMAPDFISINHRDAIRDIYGVNRNTQKSQRYYRPMHQHGDEANASIVSVINRSQHARMRRVVAHAFTDAALRNLEHYVQDTIRRFTGLLHPDHGGPVKDMAKYCTWLTYDIMGELTFGKTYGMLNSNGMDNNRDIPKFIDGMAHRALLRGVNPAMAYWGLDTYLLPSLKKDALAFFEYAVQQTKERMGMGSDRRDVFSYLLQGKEAEADGGDGGRNLFQLSADARTLIAAGTDTTAVQMAANLYYLTTNARVLARLAGEIRATFASADEIVAGAKLDGCRYLRAVVDETLRMSPSVPGGLYREALPGGVAVAGHRFPARTELAVPLYAIQHKAAYFERPFAFAPERWLPEESTPEALALARSAFEPFTIGARGCIGRKLAYMELYLTLAKVVFLYDMEYVGGGKEPLHPDVNEYRLRDHFNSAIDGPEVAFTPRQY